MEFVSNYNLEKLIVKRGNLAEEYLKILLAEIASTLSIVHDAGYVYNNLKPTHVVIDSLGHIKLIDFCRVCVIQLRPLRLIPLKRERRSLSSMSTQPQKNSVGRL